MAEKILTGVKHIYFTPWNAQDTGLDTASGAKLELLNVIADTVAITQDDPDSSEIACETRDEPIVETITIGKYQITMDSADIDFSILEKCMGFTKVGTTIAAAPTSYSKKYACIEVEMESDVFVLPRILVSSKLDASSLKTGVAKGTVSGSGYSCDVKVGSDVFSTPFFVAAKDTVYSLGKLGTLE